MQHTGFTRKIDELGRIVLPIEVRRKFGMGEKDSLDIYVDDTTQQIILAKSMPTCCSCGSEGALKVLGGGLYICQDCLKKAEESEGILVSPTATNEETE